VKTRAPREERGNEKEPSRKRKLEKAKKNTRKGARKITNDYRSNGPKSLRT